MKRYRCKITKDKEFIVERILGKSYYYKFSFRYLDEMEFVGNHKRTITIIGEEIGVSYTFGYYEKPVEDLKLRISQKGLDVLIRSAEN